MIKFKKILMALSIGLISSVVLNINASAKENVKVTRIYGNNRYETASKIANYSMGYSYYAILCNGTAYSDSIIATPVANKHECPIFLVEKDSIPQSVKDQLIKLNTRKVFIVGGESLVSKKVENELNSMGIELETRIEGANRHETSQKMEHYQTPNDECFLVYGDDYTNMSNVSAIAGRWQMPILLTDRNYYPDCIKQSNLSYKYSKIQLVTNTMDRSDLIQLANNSGIETKGVITGINGTNTMFNLYDTFKDKIDFTRVILAPWSNLADSISLSALAGQMGTVVWYVDEANIDKVKSILRQYQGKIQDILVIGSEKFIPDSWVQDIKNDAETYIPKTTNTSSNIIEVTMQPSKEQIEEQKKSAERSSKWKFFANQAMQIAEKYLGKKVNGFIEMNTINTGAMFHLEGFEAQYNGRIYWIESQKEHYDLAVDRETGNLYELTKKDGIHRYYKLVQ